MTKKIVIAVAVCWVAALVVLLAVFSLDRAETAPLQEEALGTGIVENPSAEQIETEDYEGSLTVNIAAGAWISDRSDTNMLYLETDGTFSDSDDIVGSGSYIINGDYLLLNSDNGRQYVLKYRNEQDEESLYFTIDQYDTVYSRATEEDIQEKEAKMEAETEVMENDTQLFKKKAYLTMTATDWENGTQTISFTDNTVTITENGVSETYDYTVSDVILNQGDPGGYLVAWAVTKDGAVQEASAYLGVLFASSGETIIDFDLNGVSYRISDTIEPVGSDACQISDPWPANSDT